MSDEDWRALRDEAAAKYQPDRVSLLLVAEAPPSSLDRYFYFPSVGIHDSLFRYVVRLVLGREPTRNGKAGLLNDLKEAGVFLIDVSQVPILNKSELKPCIPDLIQRAAALNPKHIILIKRTVWDAAYRPLLDAGLPVVNDEPIPFPGSGQQLRYEAAMAANLRSIGWVVPQSGFE